MWVYEEKMKDHKYRKLNVKPVKESKRYLEKQLAKDIKPTNKNIFQHIRSRESASGLD